MRAEVSNILSSIIVMRIICYQGAESTRLNYVLCSARYLTAVSERTRMFF